MMAATIKSLLERSGLILFAPGTRSEFWFYSASTLLMQASKMLTALLVARLIGPSEFGWWNSLQPLLVYGAMFHFGVLNGMNRDVPYFNGKGDPERAEYIRRVSWGITMLTAAIAAGLSIVASFFIQNNLLVENALRFLALLLFFQQWYLYKSMLLISAIRFKLLSVQQFAQAILFPAFSIWMASLWGLNGFVLAQALANFLVCVLMTWLSHYDLRPVFDWKEARHLAGVGFPIMAAGFLYDTLRTLDRWVILIFLDVTQVGYYTLAILTLQAVTLLPSVVTAQFYPRMSKIFGETGAYKPLKPLFVQTVMIASMIILPFGLAIFLLIRPLISYFLPEYVQGVGAAMIVAIGVTVSRPLAGAAATFLNAVGKASWYMRVQAVIIVMQLVLTIALVRSAGLNGVAWGVAITQMVNMLVLAGIAWRLMHTNPLQEGD
jgi:O-antigen/teichoic acid export membrane protein